MKQLINTLFGLFPPELNENKDDNNNPFWFKMVLLIILCVIVVFVYLELKK